MANEIAPTRQSIAADMYALRAGLSVVSRELGKASAERDAANNKLQNVQNSVKNTLNNCKQQIEATEKDLSYQTYLLKEKEREQYESYSSDPIRSFILTLLSFILLLLALGFVVYMICSWIYFESAGEDPLLNKWFGWYAKTNTFNYIVLIALSVVALGVVALAIYLVALTSSAFRDDIRHNKEITEKRKNARMMLNTIPKTILSLKKQLAEQKATLATEQNRCNLMLAEAKDAHKKAIAQTIATHIQPSKALYQSLLQIYSNQVDERDWANLDYIIYAVETGRADTIKETLLLLDREKQTDRIVTTIETASREIAQTLQRGFSALSKQMSNSFAMLAKKIQENTNAVRQVQKQVKIAQEEISARLEELTAQQMLTNALLARSNATSSQLVAEVSRLSQW